MDWYTIRQGMDAELKGFLDEMEDDFLFDGGGERLKEDRWARETSDVVTSIANAIAGGYQRIRAKHAIRIDNSGIRGRLEPSEAFRELDDFIYELESSLRSRLVD